MFVPLITTLHVLNFPMKEDEEAIRLFPNPFLLAKYLLCAVQKTAQCFKGSRMYTLKPLSINYGTLWVVNHSIHRTYILPCNPCNIYIYIYIPTYPVCWVISWRGGVKLTSTGVDGGLWLWLVVVSETLYHRDDADLYIAYVMLIWAAPIPADRWHCSL